MDLVKNVERCLAGRRCRMRSKVAGAGEARFQSFPTILRTHRWRRRPGVLLALAINSFAASLTNRVLARANLCDCGLHCGVVEAAFPPVLRFGSFCTSVGICILLGIPTENQTTSPVASSSLPTLDSSSGLNFGQLSSDFALFKLSENNFAGPEISTLSTNCETA
eukprot:458388-Rhodomonas_salina.1